MTMYQGLRVLVVDDERDLLDILSMLFELRGAVVQTASSGNQALAKLAPGKFDLILSDVRMADGDGLTLLRGAQLIQPKPIFFLMTGYADVTAEEAKALGADQVLHKPFEQEALDELLRQYFSRKAAG